MRHYYIPLVKGDQVRLEYLGDFKTLGEARAASDGSVLVSAKDQDIATVRYFRDRVRKAGIKLKRRNAHCSVEHIDRMTPQDKYIWQELCRLQNITHFITLDL